MECFGNGNFKFWCQKVLPLVYDDSLSYYELLCKFVDHLNNLTNDVTLVVEEMKQLKNYVDTYFDSLDIQKMIEEELDKMVTDGRLEKIISNYYLQPLVFTICGDISTNNNYSLYTSKDLKSFTKVSGYDNFIENANIRLGLEWLYFKYEDYHCWTITQDNNAEDFSSDVIVVTTKDMINFNVNKNLVGFRNASPMQGYVWTPTIFSDGEKWYCSATVQIGENEQNADKYEYSLKRNATQYYCEIRFNKETGLITPISEIKEIKLPTGKTNIDATFKYIDGKFYCLYSDRYLDTIVSCVSNSLDDEFTLLNDNVFNFLYIEAPQIFQVNDNTWFIVSCAFQSPLQRGECNLSCYTHNFTDFFNFDFLGRVEPEIYDKELQLCRRMRNPSLFILPYECVLNIKNKSGNEIITGTFRENIVSYSFGLDGKTIKMITENNLSLLPKTNFVINENIDISNLKFNRNLGCDEIVKLTFKNDTLKVTRNNINIYANNIHGMLHVSSTGGIWNAINNNPQIFKQNGWTIYKNCRFTGETGIIITYEGTGFADTTLIVDNLNELLNYNLYRRTNVPLTVFYGNTIEHMTIDLNSNGNLWARGCKQYSNVMYGTCELNLD